MALPTAIGVAIRRYAIRTVIESGWQEHFEGALRTEQYCDITRALMRLDAESVSTALDPNWILSSIGAIRLIPFRFDLDKVGVVMCLLPKITDSSDPFLNMLAKEDPWEGTLKQIQDRVAKFSEELNPSSGVFIAAIGGVGTGIAIPAPKLPDNWAIAVFSIPNFAALACHHDIDLAMLWRFARQKLRADSRDVRFINPNGDFNLFAHWRSQGYALVPDDAPARSLHFMPPTNALLDLRLETRVAVDEHGAPLPSKHSWVEVERQDGFAWFKRLRDRPFYIVPKQPSVLQGVAEANGSWWWLRLPTKPTTKMGNIIAFQVWDCIAHWLVPVAITLTDRFPAVGTAFEFFVEFPELAQWANGKAEKPTSGLIALGWSITPESFIAFSVTREFFRTFQQPANIAEREIVRALLQAGLHALGQTVAESDVAAMRDRILPKNETRHFHLIAKDDPTFLAYPGPADPWHVREEAIADSVQELGLSVAPHRLGHTIEHPNEVKELIRAAVKHLREEISRQLEGFSLVSVVSRALENLERTHREDLRWEISAAALAAAASDQKELLDVSRSQESGRAGMNSASRILIETALYSCLSRGGREIPETDLQDLLAQTLTLITTAEYNLVHRTGFTAGSVHIAKSGAFRVKNPELDRIRFDYYKAESDDGYRKSVEGYADQYAPKNSRSLPSEFEKFSAAWREELGISAQELINLSGLVRNRALDDGRVQFRVKRSELAAWCAAELKIELGRIGRAIDELTLYPRTAWDQELPEGLNSHDVLPWKFKRRFSVLRRPLIRLTNDPDPMYMVSQLMVDQSSRYLIERSFAGDFPASFYRSAAMKAWVDEVQARRSKQFVGKVAQVFAERTLEHRTEVKMAKLGAPAALGDLVVVAWDKAKPGRVFAIECKALTTGRSTAEILDQLDDFKGEPKDQLDKHLKRMEWLRTNPSALEKVTGSDTTEIVSKLVANHRLPTQFLPDTKRELFEAIDSFPRWLDLVLCRTGSKRS